MLNSFFVGWPNPPSPEVHLEMLKRSTYIVLAIDTNQKKVIGFINAISDRILASYIPLLEVLPEYQEKGIGKNLVKLMLEKLNKFYVIDLMCDPGKKEFYNRLGFTEATGMMIRNYQFQNGVKLPE